jgi:hypothetical protein
VKITREKAITRETCWFLDKYQWKLMERLFPLGWKSRRKTKRKRPED